MENIPSRGGDETASHWGGTCDDYLKEMWLGQSQSELYIWLARYN